MLNLRNTNQLQTIGEIVARGGATPEPPTPPVTASYSDGLGRSQYSVGFGGQGSPAYTASAFTTSSIYYVPPTVADSGSLVAPFLPSATGSVDWKGYFKASTTETYTFFLSIDDQSTIWIGNEATASLPLTASALVNALPGPEKSGSIALVSGSLYPMLVWYSAHASFDYFTASFSTPTITKTTDFTGYTLCNSASLGF